MVAIQTHRKISAPGQTTRLVALPQVRRLQCELFRLINIHELPQLEPNFPATRQQDPEPENCKLADRS
jgi:hypothetical protein